MEFNLSSIMKKLLLLLLLIPTLSFGQKNVVQLQTQNHSQILLKSPSSLRSYNMNDSIIQSSVNLLGSYANPSWITSLANTKITGLGTLATLTPGTGVATALGVNIGSAGAPVLFNGAGGTPSSLNLNNATGTPTLTTPVFNGLPTGTGVASGATVSTLAARDANANLSANNFQPGYTTTATAAGTTTLTVSSTSVQYFTGTTTQTVLLPVTSTLSTNPQTIFTIINNSTGIVTVQSSGGNTIIPMTQGSTLIVSCISTSGTGTASWNSQYYPALPSGAAVGDIFDVSAISGGAPTQFARIPGGTSGYVLTANGAGVAPTYQPATGGLTSSSTNQIPVYTSSSTAAGSSELTYSSRALLFGTTASGTDSFNFGGSSDGFDLNFSTGQFKWKTNSTHWPEIWSDNKFREAHFSNLTTLTESSATSFGRVTISASEYATGEILVGVQANDGTDFQALSTRFQFNAVRKGATTTINIETPVQPACACSTGTLTVTITAIDSGSGNIDFKANAVSSLTQTALQAQFFINKIFRGTAVTQ